MFTIRLFSSTLGMLGSLIVDRWGAAEELPGSLIAAEPTQAGFTSRPTEKLMEDPG